MKRILVIIVTYNGMPGIERCISSVRSSTVPADMIVIDNGSSDGTAEWLQDQGIRPEILRDNPGFGAACNVGLLRAIDGGYDFAYLLHQDAYLLPDTLGTLLKNFGGSLGIVSPVQMDGSGKKMERNFAKCCSNALKASAFEVAEVKFVMAAHWLISRDCILAAGGFSPAFKQYGEDADYIHRACFHGFKVGIVRSAAAIHDRENRKTDRDRRISLRCLDSVVRISDPNRSLPARLLLEPLRLVGSGCIHFSGIPFRYIGTLVKRYPGLIKTRRTSKRKGAFL